MRYVLIGLLCFFVVISVVFNYSSDFDYTYDGSNYDVDFVTPSNINASKIQGSFDAITHYISGITNFFSEAASEILLIFETDVNTGDSDFDAFYNELYERTQLYIEENSPWILIASRKNTFWQLTNAIKGYVKVVWFDIPVKGFPFDISDFMGIWGWSDEETCRVHEFMVEHGIRHGYDNKTYD